MDQKQESATPKAGGEVTLTAAGACSLLLLAAGALAGAAGCHRSAAEAPADPNRRGTAPATTAAGTEDSLIRAVCTTGMVADLVRNVGGRHVEVVQLMGEGVDPHLYRATPQDVSRLAGADVIFYSGLHLEGKLTEVFERMARRKPAFAVSAGVEESRLLPIEDGFHDPHVWFDVSLWSEAAGFVAEKLAAFDPPRAAEYRANARAWRRELDSLHEWCRAQLAGVPQERRVLVTAHDAFQYFGRAYGLELKAVQGVSTDSEAGVRKINELVRFLVDRRVKAVFVESSVPERAVRALVDGCAARGHQVRIGGELFSDAMGAPGTPEGTYVGMVRHNVVTIRDALH